MGAQVLAVKSDITQQTWGRWCGDPGVRPMLLGPCLPLRPILWLQPKVNTVISKINLLECRARSLGWVYTSATSLAPRVATLFMDRYRYPPQWRILHAPVPLKGLTFGDMIFSLYEYLLLATRDKICTVEFVDFFSLLYRELKNDK